MRGNYSRHNFAERALPAAVGAYEGDDFSGMNDVYAATFKPPYPARSTVEIGRLPGGMLIEVECIALAERNDS